MIRMDTGLEDGVGHVKDGEDLVLGAIIEDVGDTWKGMVFERSIFGFGDDEGGGAVWAGTTQRQGDLATQE